jgi:trimethylamine--corrinoid protein Co-methyltransferase
VRGGLSGGRYRPLSELDMENINQAALTVLENTWLG